MVDELEYCIECGEELPGEPTYCPNCGLNLDRARREGGSTDDGAGGRAGAEVGAQESARGASHTGANRRQGGTAPATEDAGPGWDDTSLVEEGEQISTVALVFMVVSGLLLVAAALAPTWYQACVEHATFGGCQAYGPVDVGLNWRVWVGLVGGIVLLSAADEYANLFAFGTWRVKKAQLLLVMAILAGGGLEPQPVDGKLALGGALILAAIAAMVTYSIPTMIWKWLFEKRVGHR